MALPLIGAIASIGSSLIGGFFGDQAAKEQAAATRYAADLQNEQFNKSLATLQPAIAAGNEARSYQLGALGLPGGNSDAVNLWRQSPGYQAGLTTGKNAVQGSAAAGGRLFSGGTLKALDRFGSNYEDQQFGNWYGRLGEMSGAGDSARNNAVSLGSANANSLSDLALREGDAKASSYTNWGSQIGSGIQSLADLYAYYAKPKAATAAPQNYAWGGLN